MAHWPATYHSKASRSHKRPRRVELGEHHHHPLPNPPVHLRLSHFKSQTTPPPFYPLESSLLLIIMHYLFLFFQCFSEATETTTFCSVHSVTEMQDLRFPVIKWKPSLGLSLCLLCSCQLGEEGDTLILAREKAPDGDMKASSSHWPLLTLKAGVSFRVQGSVCRDVGNMFVIEFDYQQVSKGPQLTVIQKINL